MRGRSQTIVLCTLAIALTIGIVALLVVRAAARTRKERQSTTTQAPAETQPSRTSKNHLSLQPEALKVARRLGVRFFATKPMSSVVIATLKIGSEARMMQMSRTKNPDEESVEIAIEGSPGPLIWNANQGGRTSAGRPTRTERELIDRLVYDSPDQFVLMQFRGASYYTVARGVRPVDAPDGYEGPLWTIVRTDDPEQDEGKRPASRWRLYYINTATGLIDRIESEVEGQRIVAEISSWTEQNGEKVPAQIVWTREGQKLMQYDLTSFSQSQTQGVNQ